jgi:hypothetical protein
MEKAGPVVANDDGDIERRKLVIQTIKAKG